jgi:hypothetical protein
MAPLLVPRIRTAFLVAAVTAVAAPALAYAASSAPAAAATAVQPVSVPAGLPADMPPAAYQAEPALPAPSGWPGRESFPRTMGSGRLDHGGFFWTDYIYDDHGALGAPTNPVEVGTPSEGGYSYPAGAAHDNGADIFRAAVQLTSAATYWRVDWNTLADPNVPIAEWTFDRDGNTTTGTAAWPAGASVNSAGIDTALVVSSRGARLTDAATGAVRAQLPTIVDSRAKSFLVKVPRSVLSPTGNWKVRLAAGLADASGTSFTPPALGTPSAPPVSNVAFRSYSQESPTSFNFWNDNAQARALATHDVSAFSAALNWADLTSGRTTPAAQPTGWSERWYVSSVNLGDGKVTGADTLEDFKPNYLGQVQPYTVYVPQTYRPGTPTPLTFLLHSFTQNHNQYASTTPKFTQEACEARKSICVTTLGRGPDGFFYGTAELDFWEVWNRVAGAYSLDPNRTVLSGYSMGGIGSNQLAMAHPDLFASDVTLAGAVGNQPALENLREVPVYLAGGAEDELVPVTTEKAQANALDALGYRYRWLLYPAEDHVALELQDGFSDAATYMGKATRSLHPARVTFRWTPHDVPPVEDPSPASVAPSAVTQQPALGVGTTGAYWLRSLAARSTATDARIVARSFALPDPAKAPVRSNDALVPGDPSPAVVTQLTWLTGAVPAVSPAIQLALTNVSGLTLELADAGITPGHSAQLHVTTDGPTAITLHGSHTTTVQVAAGTHTIAITG